MPDGFSADQDEIRADQLTREMTEAFVEKVIVWPGQKLGFKVEDQEVTVSRGALGHPGFFRFGTYAGCLYCVRITYVNCIILL